MNNFAGVIMNELQKLFSKKKTIVLLAMAALAGFLPAFFISAIQARIVIIAFISLSFPLIILSVITNIFIPLFIFAAAAELFSGEAADRTMKLVLTRPVSRFKAYVSKNTAIGIYTIINLFVVFLVSTISSLVLKLNAQNTGHIFLSYLIDIIPLLVFGLFSAFLVQFFRSSSSALICSILVFGGIKLLSLLMSRFNNIIFTSYLNWYPMWTSGGSSFLRNANTLVMLAAYGIIFFTLGYFVFDRKEF